MLASKLWMALCICAFSSGVWAVEPESRVNRHALIIGISHYADPKTPPLPGARFDRQSATKMAQAMQVPVENIAYLQDEQASGDAIRNALRALNDRVQEGDRVFIHYSGHGTRFRDSSASGCVEALLAYDGGPNGTITNREMAELLRPMTAKTDKMFVMYDACHSGGLVTTAAGGRTRGIVSTPSEGRLRPKVANISEECGQPVNIKTRSLTSQAEARGILLQDIIHVSAARDDEISFDDELKGGLATQFMRDCMLRDAVDQDQSGAISIDEIRSCAQEKIDQRMRNDPYYKSHNLVLQGNRGFVPAWFSKALETQAISDAANQPAIEVSGERALRQMLEQADAKRNVQVNLINAKLKIGKDALQMTLTSDRAGYAYVLMAGSDNIALSMLFPNDLDQDNRIEAGKPLVLPRPQWRVRASGPIGVNHLLVMVSDGPRAVASPDIAKTGPFVTSLNDAKGRAQLGALMTTSSNTSPMACAKSPTVGKIGSCSDAYGARMLSVEEIE